MSNNENGLSAKIAFGSAALTAAYATFLAVPSAAIFLLGVAAGYAIITAANKKDTTAISCHIAVGQALFGAHLLMMNEYSGAIVALVTAARVGAQAYLHTKNEKLSNLLAVGGFTAAAGLYVAFNHESIKGLWDLNNIPLLTMAVASFAERLTSKDINLKRGCYLISSWLQMPYHGFQTNSLPGLAINSLVIAELTAQLIFGKSAIDVMREKLDVTKRYLVAKLSS